MSFFSHLAVFPVSLTKSICALTLPDYPGEQSSQRWETLSWWLAEQTWTVSGCSARRVILMRCQINFEVLAKTGAVWSVWCYHKLKYYRFSNKKCEIRIVLYDSHRILVEHELKWTIKWQCQTHRGSGVCVSPNHWPVVERPWWTFGVVLVQIFWACCLNGMKRLQGVTLILPADWGGFRWCSSLGYHIFFNPNYSVHQDVGCCRFQLYNKHLTRPAECPTIMP